MVNDIVIINLMTMLMI